MADGDLEGLGVVVVTELIENLINSSSGNTTVCPPLEHNVYMSMCVIPGLCVYVYVCV